MNIRTTAGACALFLGGAFTAYSFTSQTPDEKAMYELMAPGEHHKLLEDKVGKWNMTVKMAETPMGPASESPATSEMKWILDGRFIQDDTHGSFGGMPFTGLGLGGYDNMKKKYVSIWMDSMGTGVMSTEGTYDAKSKTFTYTGEMQDPMQMKMVPVKMVEKVTDKDNWSMTMFTTGPGGKDIQMMEILYKRAK